MQSNLINNENNGTKYYGRVVSVPNNGNFGFIGRTTVTTEDGKTPTNLDTQNDIFIHQDECAEKLEVGIEVEFTITEDKHRGIGFCRAFGATKVISGELVPAAEAVIPGFTAIETRKSTALTKTLYHLNAKDVPEETIKKVIENEPLSEVPRINKELSEDEKLNLLKAMLATFFPALALFSADFNILEMSSDALDAAVAENEENLNLLGMTQQIEDIREEIGRFKGMKGTLSLIYNDGLVRPDTIIPMKHLVDLFMAVPVWYFWIKPEEIARTEATWREKDPQPQAEIIHFCNLFPTEKWANIYQLFNRRIRSLRMYQGDKIPPFVSRRLVKSIEAFDYIVIATPYHDKAGMDWEDLNWLRMPDPYVLGFKKGIPYFFILARFSDSGTFPLFNEMVADTIEFLKENKEKLKLFNVVDKYYWYNPEPMVNQTGEKLGSKLKSQVETLFEKFEEGNLFTWLREVGTSTE